MELGKDLVEALFKESDQTDMIAFKNALYLKLAQNYLRYRWVITYLFGAAPVAEQGFFDQEVPEPCVPSVTVIMVMSIRKKSKYLLQA